MITRTVALPNTFWEPELHIPRNDTWRDAAFDEAYNSLKHYAAVVTQEESTGIVDRTNIINLLLSAWAIRLHKSKLRQRDPQLAQRLAGMREVAKRYGLTKIWDAAYYDTMLRKLNDRCTGDTRAGRVYCCARCGRTIFASLSVKRGIGPVCWHKRGS